MMQRKDRVLWIVLGMLALLMLAQPMLGDGPVAYPFTGWYGPHSSAGAWLTGFAGLVAVIGGVLLIVRTGWSPIEADRPTVPPPREDFLRWRYATGGITRGQNDETSRAPQSEETA